MHRYCMHFMYDGTNYSGWQVQPNGLSIQQIVEEAVHTILREDVSVVGSGRTDAGVHALDQVAHFSSAQELDTEAFFRSLNGLLPFDIRLTKVYPVPLNFHAQKSAIQKAYHYYLCLNSFVPPFKRLYCLHVHHKLDLELLDSACKLFLGTHDFTSFANSAHEGAASKNAVRTIFRLDAVPWEYGIRLEFVGNGFLYK